MSTIVLIVLIVLVVGIGTLLWTSAGIARAIAARRPGAGHVENPISRDRVAILIAAHNEEMVIAKTLVSAARHVPLNQIFVASDFSTDSTLELASSLGVHVFGVAPNLGKAGAIVEALHHYRIAENYDVVMLLDADTVLDDDYLDSGLAMFSSDDVVAVAGTASSMMDPMPRKLSGKIFVAYRQRVYLAMQYMMKYGQAASRINVVTIVPGFASMYRTSILDKVDIAAPGLAIEDYNMTFEVHSKHLGRIAFNPRAAIAYTQDPDTLAEYSKQAGRWALGFWQTVRRHPWQPRRFWVALWLHVLELITASTLLVLVVPVIVASTLAGLIALTGTDATGTALAIFLAVPPWIILLGVIVPDYLLTIGAAIVSRKPIYLALGIVFPLLRILDGFLCLRAFGRAFRSTPGGRWVSPARRVDTVAH
jgi:cellulose synthase/poly-beta-1,6-N-acetylglucosamine synthase-like glycosyltransferase